MQLAIPWHRRTVVPRRRALFLTRSQACQSAGRTPQACHISVSSATVRANFIGTPKVPAHSFLASYITIHFYRSDLLFSTLHSLF